MFLQQRFAGGSAGAIRPCCGPARETRRRRRGALRALLHLERTDEAIGAAEAAGAADAPEADWLLGRALLAAGEVVRAVEVLRVAAMDGDPRVLVGYGQALLAADRPKDAAAAFRRALARGQEPVAARVGLGSALATLGELAAAEAAYRRAVAALPSYARGALGLAELQWRTGRREQAIGTLVDCLVLDPTHVGALVRLGSWLEESNMSPGQASTAYRRAVRLDPEHPVAREGLDRLGGARGSTPDRGKRLRCIDNEAD